MKLMTQKYIKKLFQKYFKLIIINHLKVFKLDILIPIFNQTHDIKNDISTLYHLNPISQPQFHTLPPIKQPLVVIRITPES